MQKIAVIGTTGSGKSFLARQLTEKTGVPCIDLDELHWLPGWKERNSEEFCRLVDDATRGDAWVAAGNYTSRAQPIIRARADTLIWLDIPFWSNFRQVFFRTIKRACSGEKVCNGNRETLAKSFFSRQSILLWFLKSWGKDRKKNTALFARPQDYPHLKMIRLRSYAEIRNFLQKRPVLPMSSKNSPPS